MERPLEPLGGRTVASEWNHPICSFCWPAFIIGQSGKLKTPCTLIDPESERCHFCGGDTRSGIYVRADPVEPPYSPDSHHVGRLEGDG